MAAALCALLAAAAAGCGEPAPKGSGDRRDEPPPAFRDDALGERIAAVAAGAHGTAIRGANGWRFLTEDALLLANRRIRGPLEGRSTRIRPEAADPFPPIVHFARALEERGIALLFVVVPAKLAIYPDGLFPETPAPEVSPDLATSDLLSALRSEGIEALDLAPSFLARRREGAGVLFAKTDSHWSPLGCLVAARAVAARMHRSWPELAPEPKDLAESDYDVVEREIWGDLFEPGREGEARGPEPLLFYRNEPLRIVDGVPPDWDPRYLVLGDSNLTVYRGRSAGFTDHLGTLLGRPARQLALIGGSATSARQALARRPELLDGLRLVVWVCSARFFVSGLGWSETPLPPAAPVTTSP